MKENLIKDKTYKFALNVLALRATLRNKKEFEISSQLLRAGTGIGANVEEAIAAQSYRNFISKMSIATKESRESNYWLRLIRDTGIFDKKHIQPLIDESEDIRNILTKIVKTSVEKQKRRPRDPNL